MPAFLLPLLGLKDIFVKLLGFFLDNWKEITIFVLLSIVIYQNFYPKPPTVLGLTVIPLTTIPHLEEQLRQAQEQFEVCAEGNRILSETIDARNEEIQRWKDETDALQEEFDKVEERLRNRRTQTNQRVERIIREDTRPKDSDAAIEFLRGAKERLKWD
jgi:hypothetical protein